MTLLGRIDKNFIPWETVKKMRVWMVPEPDIVEQYECPKCGFRAEFNATDMTINGGREFG